MFNYQLPDSGPYTKAVALPDELAAQILKEQFVIDKNLVRSRAAFFFQ